MTTREPRASALRRGIGLGFVITFAIVIVAALALGADLWIAAVIALFMGFFVGGGLGVLIAGRLASEPD